LQYNPPIKGTNCPIVAAEEVFQSTKTPWRFPITSSLISGLYTTVTLEPDVRLPLGQDRHQRDYHLLAEKEEQLEDASHLAQTQNRSLIAEEKK